MKENISMFELFKLFMTTVSNQNLPNSTLLLKKYHNIHICLFSKGKHKFNEGSIKVKHFTETM